MKVLLKRKSKTSFIFFS